MKKLIPIYPLCCTGRNNILLLFIMCSSSFQILFAQPGSLLFRDDFNRSSLGTNWKADNTWSVLNGAAYNPYDAGSLITTKNYTSDSYTLETAAMGFKGSYWREFRITFGQADVSSQKTYVLTYSPDTGGQLTLGRATDNVYHPEILDQIGVYPELVETQWYKFKIARYKSGLIQVYINRGSGYDAIPVLEAIDSTYPQLGHFGWMVSTQTAGEKFYVDWIEARIPETEKPAIPEKPVEDDLITQVSTVKGRPYKVSKLISGANMYADRNYQVTSVPSYLQGASFIQTAMDDKKETGTSWLTTFIKKSVIVYIAYDPRATVLPAWLQEWHKTGDIIGTTDPGSKYMELYSKSVDYWELYPRPFILGANLESPAAGAQTNYLVIAVQRPDSKNLEAEDAKVVGAQMARDHTGYSGSGFVDFVNQKQDYIEWTTQTVVPGTYNLGFQFANGGKTDRSLRLTVDGVVAEISIFSPIANWDSWAFYSGAYVYLKPGAHKIRLAAIGTGGPNIDFLSVNFKSDYPEQSVGNRLAREGALNFDVVGNAIDFSTMAYPNPFERSTTISYQLPEATSVNLTVYTLQGLKQAVLVDGIQEAGKYEVEFSPNNLTAGSYIYQLKQGNTVSVGKVVKQ